MTKYASRDFGQAMGFQVKKSGINQLKNVAKGKFSVLVQADSCELGSK